MGKDLHVKLTSKDHEEPITLKRLGNSGYVDIVRLRIAIALLSNTTALPVTSIQLDIRN